MTLTWRILTGDVRETLKSLPDGCVQTCVTSPPYWSLRDYGHAGQLGLEATPDAYVANLVAVFSDVRRVLTDDGTVWLVIGDSYSGSGKGGNPDEGKQATNRGSQSIGVLYGKTGQTAREAALTNVSRRWTADNGIRPKQLIGIPWRVAFALQADGWYLRSDIIWSKPNPMPESVTDRPTKAHEYIFLLSKQPRYFYDASAIREPYAPSTLREFQDGYQGQARKVYEGTGAQNPSEVKRRIIERSMRFSHDTATARSLGKPATGNEGKLPDLQGRLVEGGGANKRSVWHVATQPYAGAHFATYPEALIEPCILAGSRLGDTVLDPFTGSGTTGAVAIGNGRNFIGCELNPAYVELAEKRIGAVAPLFAERTA